MEPGGSATTTNSRVRRWLSGWGVKQWQQAGVVAVLAGTAAFGGLDTVNKHVTDIKPGEQFDTGEFELTVQRATLVDDVRAGKRILFPAKQGKRYLGLVVTAHNTGTLPGVVGKPVRLVDQPNATELPPMRVADGTLSGRLGPGLTDQIVLLWQVPEDALSVGGELPVQIWKEVPRLNVTAGQGWVLGKDYAQLTVPIGGPK